MVLGKFFRYMMEHFPIDLLGNKYVEFVEFVIYI